MMEAIANRKATINQAFILIFLLSHKLKKWLKIINPKIEISMGKNPVASSSNTKTLSRKGTVNTRGERENPVHKEVSDK
jgi:hypothetical protein